MYVALVCSMGLERVLFRGGILLCGTLPSPDPRLVNLLTPQTHKHQHTQMVRTHVYCLTQGSKSRFMCEQNSGPVGPLLFPSRKIRLAATRVEELPKPYQLLTSDKGEDLTMRGVPYVHKRTIKDHNDTDSRKINTHMNTNTEGMNAHQLLPLPQVRPNLKRSYERQGRRPPPSTLANVTYVHTAQTPSASVGWS